MPTFQELYPQFYTDEYQNSGPERPPDPNPDVAPISQYSAFATMGKPNPRDISMSQVAGEGQLPRYADLRPPASSLAQKLIGFTGGNYARDYANQQQKFDAIQENREQRKQAQANADAEVEGLLLDRIQKAPPEYRDPFVKAATRWYDAKGRKLDSGWVDFYKKASEDEIALMKDVGEEMLSHIQDPEKREKFQKHLQTSPSGFATAYGEFLKRNKIIAETKKLSSEGEMNTMMADAAKKSMAQEDSEPSGSPTSPPSSSPRPIPQGGVPTQPGPSQGPLKRTSAYPEYLLTPEGQKVQQFVINKARQLGIDPAYAQALIDQESGWNPQATSPTGVQGLAQVTKTTGKPYGQDPNMRTNPIVSANAGLTYFAALLKETNGNYQKALMRYNGGSDPQYVQNVESHLQKYGGLAKPSTQAVADGATDEDRKAIQGYNKKINELEKLIDRFKPFALNENAARAMTRWEAQLADYRKAKDSIEKRYEDAATPEQKTGSIELFGKPWVQASTDERKAVIAYNRFQKREDKAADAAAEAEATEGSKIRVAKAARENEVVQDVNKYQDAEGNPPPVGWDLGKIRQENEAAKKVSGKEKYIQVDKLPDAQETKLTGFATSYGLTDKLITQLQDKPTRDALKPVIGSIMSDPSAWYQRSITGRVKGLTPKQQEFAANLALQMVQLRKEFLGTAQSQQELAAASPFLASLADATPETILAKLKAIRAFTKMSHDTIRSTAVGLKQRVPPGLPEIAPDTDVTTGTPTKRPNPLGEAFK
jgi:transglycosylase-like protein with SLT domain